MPLHKVNVSKATNCKTSMEDRTKTLQVAKNISENTRKEDLERILSGKGIPFQKGQTGVFRQRVLLEI